MRSINRLNTRGNGKGGVLEKKKGEEKMKRAGVLTSTMLWRMIRDNVTAFLPLSGAWTDFMWDTLSGKGQTQSVLRKAGDLLGF